MLGTIIKQRAGTRRKECSKCIPSVARSLPFGSTFGAKGLGGGIKGTRNYYDLECAFWHLKWSCCGRLRLLTGVLTDCLDFVEVFVGRFASSVCFEDDDVPLRGGIDGRRNIRRPPDTNGPYRES